MTLTADEPVFSAAVNDVRTRMCRAGRGRVTVSKDRHSALVIATIDRPVSIDELRADVLAAGAANPRVTIEETGDISASDARDRAIDSDLERAELLSVPVTLLVLLFAFGAIVAALVPVLLALTAVVATFGLLGPVSQVFPLDDSTKTVIVLIGMAVGVDYALFYVIRSREERRRGLPSHQALERTARTSGRTVVVSGTTVAVAMAGMYVVGSKIFNGLASATILVVACAVAGSVTVLPAVLELLGTKIDRGRIPFLPHVRTESADSRFWPAVVNRVLRRPLLSCVLSASLLVALAMPALLAARREAERRVARGAERARARDARPRPRRVSRHGRDGDRRRDRPERRSGRRRSEQLQRLENLAVARGIAHPPFTVSGNDEGTAASIEFPLVGDGNNAASRRAIADPARRAPAGTLGSIPGVETAVTGAVAEDVDFTSQMKHGVPYVIAFVLALGFLLLLVAFRSIVVPLKAIVLNLLSVGAAYGVLVLVFQHTWAEPLLDFKSNGAIISWLPLFLFVVLFGLSMDYHVFILSRIREAVDGGMSTDDAVRYGITITAGVVTSAALVMVGVFSLFGSLSSLELKQAGVGLAAAVLIDATIIRAVLLPASMTLLGEWNWYLPRALERLPKAPIEAPPAGETL